MDGEPLLTWKGRRVRSPGDGPDTAARKVPEGPLRPGSLFFVPSPLEGWGLERLLDRLPDAGAVVLFEKDPDLEDAVTAGRARWLGARAADPRLFVLRSDTEEAVRELFGRLPLNRLRRCEFLPLTGTWTAHAPRYREVFRRLEEGLKTHWANRLTALHLGPLWIRNLLDNLADPTATAAAWPDWGDDPVVVCGAGLSLEAALPWLRDHRRQVRLLAADTALPVLRDAGLIPDAAVAVEAQHANLADFAGSVGADITLFADLTSLPAGRRVFGPPPCWFISEFAPVALWRDPSFPEVPRLPPLGSVGVAAAWIAWRLSRGPVVLAGLDFCYPPGKTHARGAPGLRSLLTRTDRFRPVEQTGTWKREGLRVTPAGALTSPAMESYAGVLRDEGAAEAARTWVSDGSGLPLGLGLWDRTAGRNLGPAGTRAPGEPFRSDQWLTPRRERWRALLRDLEAGGTGWPDLRARLESCDELWFWFPDPEPRPEADWLLRARVQLRWALDRTAPRGSSGI